MGEFFKTNKFKIISAIVALLLGMMLYFASADGVENIPKNLLSIVVAPFQKATSVVSKSVGGFLDQFFNYKDTADENQKLKDEIAELNKKLVDYQKVKDENEQLKEVAGIKEIYPDFETTIGFVISRDPNDRFSSFMIDKGSLHGVSVNDPVITEMGLVGIVTSVGPISSRVHTILSPLVNVSAIEIETKELGVVSGQTDLSETNLTRLSILSSTTNLKVDDMVITAGASGIFPKGIPIGKIKEIKGESHGVTKYAIIEPIESIIDVTTVQVITNFNGQGSKLIDYLDE